MSRIRIYSYCAPVGEAGDGARRIRAGRRRGEQCARARVVRAARVVQHASVAQELARARVLVVLRVR